MNYRRRRTSALDTTAKHWDQFALEVSIRQTVQEEVDGVIDRCIAQWMTKFKVRTLGSERDNGPHRRVYKHAVYL